ncbi:MULTISPECIES: toxin-antitoxin system HicB family antitoxin [Lactobacillaceae]|uniref:toxin-antitoxin system HicB family antitoxin n=1 Tax=Lactobacillaceae TaxID=33958 RepID=UPI00145659C2|nr:toxin-antitoxin system HicB family antitoxin [Lactobacillus sp. HBUAS51381]NLR09547.1 toxin-antitoxin system HicB family antitoxin [Lactobacillus sp. HBUAS51381]
MKDLNYYMGLDYSFVITPITEDDGEKYFQLSIPDLPGFKIYENTEEELRKSLDDAKSAWFLANIEAHESIPEPKREQEFSGRVTLRMSKSLHAQLDFQAKREDVSLNAYINELLESRSERVSVTSYLESRIKGLFKTSRKLSSQTNIYNIYSIGVGQAQDDKDSNIKSVDTTQLPKLLQGGITSV